MFSHEAHQFLWFLNEIISVFITPLVTGENLNLYEKNIKYRLQRRYVCRYSFGMGLLSSKTKHSIQIVESVLFVDLT